MRFTSAFECLLEAVSISDDQASLLELDEHPTAGRSL
jgi:hypothetical protein